MRKFLLMIAVALFTTATYAQTEEIWNSSISAVGVEDVVDFNSPTAMDKEGNLYVTGTQTKNFEFAGNDAEVLALGAYIAKYNAKGEELFAITLHGSISITAITTDAYNNFYVAGSFADEAYITDIEGTNGEYEIIQNSEADSRTATFIAKYDANGNLLAVKSYEAAANLDAYDLTRVSVSKIVADNSKIYVQFDYTGDFTVEENLSLVAKYAFYDFGGWGMAVLTNNVSVISFDTNFENAAVIASLAIADNGEPSTTIRSFNFLVNGEDLYVAAFGEGNLMLTTSAGSEAIDFEFDGAGNTEKGGVISNVGVKTVKFSNVPNSAWANYDAINGMEVRDGNLYLAGTFGETCAFDNSKVATGSSDVFVASVDADELSINWVYTNANDEGATNQYYEEVTGVAFGKEHVYVVDAITDMNNGVEPVAKNYAVSYTGEAKEATAIAATAVAYNNEYVAFINYTDATHISMYNEAVTTTIEDIEAEVENGVIYDLAGRRVEKITESGIYIVDGNKLFVK